MQGGEEICILGAKVLHQVIRYVRDPDVQRKIAIGAILLSGGAPFTGCAQLKGFAPATCKFIASVQNSASSDCDPSVNLHDPNFDAGATISLRTPAAGGDGVTLFARTGVLVPIDGKSTATLPNLAGPVTTTGNATLQTNVTVPLMGGVTIPAKNVGIPIPNLSFEAYGGAQIQNRTLSYSLNEVGLPGTSSASSNYTTIDPAFGAGIQYYLGTFYGVPTSLGINYTVDMLTSTKNVVGASPNFPGIGYSVGNAPHISGTAAATLNFDLNGK
jgi:hypothetical protein